MPTRNVRPFCHLRVHSAYSLGVGFSSPAALCRHAARSGFSSLAITDIHSTFGFVEFHREAQRCGIKPIYGSHLQLGGAGAGRRSITVLLVALDRRGLRTVCELTGRAAAMRERDLPVSVDLFDGATGGVVAIAGWVDNETGALGLEVRATLGMLREMFGERTFVENRCGEDGRVERMLDDASHDLRIPRVLTQVVRYAGEPRRGGPTGFGDDAGDRKTFGAHAAAPGPEHAMRDSAELSRYFERAPEAFSNAAVIAALVQPDLLAAIDERPAEDDREAFWHEGDADPGALRGRVLDELERKVPVSRRAPYVARVDEELADIRRFGLTRAFVDFSDLTSALRDMRVTLGPGTGMRMQSVCAWLLGITRFDPLEFDPWFSPSLDPSARALDLQGPLEAHGVITTALGRRFDAARIGYVPGIERITALRALRAVAGSDADNAPRGIDEVIAVAARHPGVSLRELVEENDELSKRLRRSAALRRAIAHASRLEGLPWSFIRTRRTLAVSAMPLRDVLAVVTRPDTGERFVLATRESFPSGSVVRVDIATLGALSALADRGEVGEEHALDAVWPAGLVQMVRRGEVDGVYLLDTAASRDALSSYVLRGFDDLVRFVALMRARGTDTTFAGRVRAFGSEPGPWHEDPLVRPSCEAYRTRGYMMFHEQLRDVTSSLTGLDRQESARMLDRFGERGPGETAKLRAEFMRACADNAAPMEAASRWFVRLGRLNGRLPRFQSVVADAMIAARMIEFRSRDLAAYYAALLRSSVPARRAELRKAVVRDGLMLGPDLYCSGRDYRAEDGRVRPPLWSIEGVRRETAEWVRRTVRKKKFDRWEEFRCLAEEKGINYKEIAALKRAGALEPSHNSAEQSATVRDDPGAVDLPEAGAVSGQYVFGFDGETGPTARDVSNVADDLRNQPSLPRVVGNKSSRYRVVGCIAEFFPQPYATPVELAGCAGDLHKLKTSSGQTVVFFVLSDSSAFVRVFVPWERVLHSGQPLSDGVHVRVRGTVRKRAGKKVLHALEVKAIEGGVSNGETPPDEPAA